jgi:hypothetical protein
MLLLQFIVKQVQFIYETSSDLRLYHIIQAIN